MYGACNVRINQLTIISNKNFTNKRLTLVHHWFSHVLHVKRTHTYFFLPNLNKLFHGKYLARYDFTQIYSKRIFFERFVPTVIRPFFIYLSIKREYDVIPLFRKFGAVSTIKCKITFAMRLLLLLLLKLFNFFRTIFFYLFARQFSMSPMPTVVNRYTKSLFWSLLT